MKKRLIIGLALVSALTASAQKELVKECDRLYKDNSEQAFQKIQPALTDPTTAEEAETWVVASRAGLGFYQDATIAEATGQPFSPEKADAAAIALLDSYKYLLKALPLDSVVDAKGKVKTKYSKEIVKTIRDRYPALRNAGIMAWGNHDYDGAYNIWQMYLDLPKNPLLGKEAPKADPDTLQGELMWNQSIALLLQQKNAEALAKLREMEPYGYMPADYYNYALGAAQAIGDEEAANEIARKGLKTPQGATNPSFIAQLINTEISAKNYPAAYTLVEEALQVTPAENTELRSQLYNIIGNINETEEKTTEAADNFRKSIEIDPNYAKSYFDLGRIIYNDALKIDETLVEQAERDAKVTPMLLDAAANFEKAYGMDENLSQIPSILFRLYYRLGAGYEDKMNYWQNM